MKAFLEKFGKWIAAGLALIVVLYLLYRLVRGMEYRYSDTFASEFWKGGKTHAEIGAQSLIPKEYWSKELLVMNTPTAIMKGDKVKVTYDDSRRASGEYEVIYVHRSPSALVLNAAPSPDGGPWKGTVQLV